MVSNSKYLLLEFLKSDEKMIYHTGYQVYDIQTGDKVFEVIDSDISTYTNFHYDILKNSQKSHTIQQQKNWVYLSRHKS